MDDLAKATSEVSYVRAVLVGGPTEIPNLMRTRKVGPQEQKIKVPHYGGYEHFERADETGHDVATKQIVYRWTMRTEIAE
jgi:hypothetical protein